MIKKLTRLFMIATFTVLLLTSTIPADASGGQVRGDNALGSAVQVQVQDPPPFQP